VPTPAGSKMDLSLAKAEPISNGGNASGITCLRDKKKKHKSRLQLERGVRICESNNSADTKVSEEGGGRRCSRHQNRGSPAAHDEDHGEAGCPSAAHGGPWWSRSRPAACAGPHAGLGGSPQEGVTTCWSRLLPGPVDPWREEPMPEQLCWQDL